MAVPALILALQPVVLMEITASSVCQYFKFQKPNTTFGLEFRVPSGELSTEEVPLCQEQLDHQ